MPDAVYHWLMKAMFVLTCIVSVGLIALALASHI